MLGRGAAAAADDRGAAIAGQNRIIGHQGRGAIVMDMPVVVFRDAGVALGDQRAFGARGGKAQHRAQQVGRADAAIGAEGQRRVGQLFHHLGHPGRGDAHHRAARGVKAHGAAPGHSGQLGGLSGGLVFLGRRDGFHPQHIGAALFQPLGLFVKHLDRHRIGQRAHRLHDLAGRPDGTRHHHRTTGGIGHLAAQFGGGAVQFAHPVLGAVQFQARRIAAERIGQKQVRSGIDRAAIQRADLLGLVHVPQLRRVARAEAHVEQVGAGGAISQKPVAGFKQAGERIGHLSRPFGNTQRAVQAAHSRDRCHDRGGFANS